MPWNVAIFVDAIVNMLAACGYVLEGSLLVLLWIRLLCCEWPVKHTALDFDVTNRL